MRLFLKNPAELPVSFAHDYSPEEKGRNDAQETACVPDQAIAAHSV